MRILTYILAFMVVLLPAGVGLGADPPVVESALQVELSFPWEAEDAAGDPGALRKWQEFLRGKGIAVDRCGFNPQEGTVVAVIPDESKLQELLDSGFAVVRTLPQAPLEADLRTQSAYFDPSEIEAALAQVAADHPDITKLFTIGTTYLGDSIYALEISDNPGASEDEPAIQFNAQHHAREVATSHVLMDIVETLTDGYGVDAAITSWVEDYKTVCVPMVNPDGVWHVFDVYSFWRKNRQVWDTCTGVDLNRNYPYLWGPGCGSSGTCASSTYRGPSVSSELETQAMMQLEDQYSFTMATSYHSSGRFIDYPYACSDGSPSEQMPEHAVIDEMMHGVADGIFAVDGVSYTVFSPVAAGGVNGDDTSWYYAHKGVYSFIIEVGTSFEPDFSQVAGIVDRNRGGWEYMYDRLGRARIDVHVTDGCTGEPIEAGVTLTDYLFDTGELARNTSLPFGRWTFVVVADATYTVRATKPGYVTQDALVAVGDSPASVDIALVPETECEVAPVPVLSHMGRMVMGVVLLIAASLVLGRRHLRDLRISGSAQ